MAHRTLVTFGSDGFRDFVTLPDGRTFNLGSVSVLNFVVGLARNGFEAKRALDTFLAKQQATLAVQMPQLEELLAPRRARWATLEETLIPSDPRTSVGQGMELTKAHFESRLASLENDLHRLEHGGVKLEEALPRVQEAVQGLVAVASPPSPEPKTAAIDEDLQKELEVYLDNEGSLQAQRRQILKKLVSDEKYDLKEAAREWEKWVDAGAKAYSREFDTDPKQFSEELKDSLAKKLAQETKKAIEDGMYDHLKAASVEGQEPEAPKQAADDLLAEEVALLNEGIAHAVMAKVEKALEAVTSSTSKFASQGQLDLHRIASDLTDLLREADMSSTDARSVLLDLSKKADHVLNYFAR